MTSDEAWKALEKLTGVWEGAGRAFYPTIHTYEYRERLDIDVAQPGSPALRYLQETWKVTADGEEPSHIESGFIGVADDGTIRMLNAQGDTRTEILIGTVTTSPAGVVLDLASSSVDGDPRVTATQRSLTLTSDTITYTQAMSTTAVPGGGPHLEAMLHRSS